MGKSNIANLEKIHESVFDPNSSSNITRFMVGVVEDYVGSTCPKGNDDFEKYALIRGKVRVRFTEFLNPEDNNSGLSNWIPAIKRYSLDKAGNSCVPRNGMKVLVAIIGSDFQNAIILGSLFDKDHLPASSFMQGEFDRPEKFASNSLLYLSDNFGISIESEDLKPDGKEKNKHFRERISLFRRLEGKNDDQKEITPFVKLQFSSEDPKETFLNIDLNNENGTGTFNVACAESFNLIASHPDSFNKASEAKKKEEEKKNQNKKNQKKQEEKKSFNEGAFVSEIIPTKGEVFDKIQNLANKGASSPDRIFVLHSYDKKSGKPVAGRLNQDLSKILRQGNDKKYTCIFERKGKEKSGKPEDSKKFILEGRVDHPRNNVNIIVILLYDTSNSLIKTYTYDQQGELKAFQNINWFNPNDFRNDENDTTSYYIDEEGENGEDSGLEGFEANYVNKNKNAYDDKIKTYDANVAGDTFDATAEEEQANNQAEAYKGKAHNERKYNDKGDKAGGDYFKDEKDFNERTGKDLNNGDYEEVGSSKNKGQGKEKAKKKAADYEEYDGDFL